MLVPDDIISCSIDQVRIPFYALWNLEYIIRLTCRPTATIYKQVLALINIRCNQQEIATLLPLIEVFKSCSMTDVIDIELSLWTHHDVLVIVVHNISRHQNDVSPIFYALNGSICIKIYRNQLIDPVLNWCPEINILEFFGRVADDIINRPDILKKGLTLL